MKSMKLSIFLLCIGILGVAFASNGKKGRYGPSAEKRVLKFSTALKIHNDAQAILVWSSGHSMVNGYAQTLLYCYVIIGFDLRVQRKCQFGLTE